MISTLIDFAKSDIALVSRTPHKEIMVTGTKQGVITIALVGRNQYRFFGPQIEDVTITKQDAINKLADLYVVVNE